MKYEIPWTVKNRPRALVEFAAIHTSLFWYYYVSLLVRLSKTSLAYLVATVEKLQVEQKAQTDKLVKINVVYRNKFVKIEDRLDEVDTKVVDKVDMIDAKVEELRTKETSYRGE